MPRTSPERIITYVLCCILRDFVNKQCTYGFEAIGLASLNAWHSMCNMDYVRTVCIVQGIVHFSEVAKTVQAFAEVEKLPFTLVT